jgi:hypothetical protein
MLSLGPVLLLSGQKPLPSLGRDVSALPLGPPSELTHCPDALHAKLAAHVPHNPLQPSEPHALSEHDGVHTGEEFDTR